MSRDRTELGPGALWLVVAAGAVGVVNYALSLALVWLLPAVAYAQAISATALLLVFGTVAGAGIPWLLAQEVVATERGSTARRRSLRFACQLAVVGGVASAAVVWFLVSRYGPVELAAAAAAATVAVFLAAVGAGYLQGTGRFGALAGYRATEAGAKLVTAVAAAAVGFGAAGVVGGAVLGAGACVLITVVVLSRAGDLPARTGHDRQRSRGLARAALLICGLQAAVVALTSLDVIVGSLVVTDVGTLAGYQAVQVFGKAALFVGAALATAAYPRLADPTLSSRTRALVEGEVARSYLWLAGTISVVLASAPPALLGLVLPARYAGDTGLLLPLSVAGFAAGGLVLLVTAAQAERAYRSTGLVLAVATVLQVPALVLAAGDVTRLAWTAAVGLLLTCGLVRLPRWRAHESRAHESALVPAPLVAAGPWLALVAVLGAATRPVTVLWLVCAVVLGLAAVAAVRTVPRRPGPLRVLHLGFEDPAAPGAGGGSRRTHEISSRIAATGVEITVVCAGYPGCRTERRDGVLYTHAGWALGRRTGHPLAANLAYFAAVAVTTAWRARRLQADVVVEDFAPPFSTIGVPLLTPRPVVGVVQWLFAEQKARQYHLPFHWVQRLGLATHHDLVAVSEGLAEQLRTRNPRARVEAVPNGLDPLPTTSPTRSLPGDVRTQLVFLGRLETAQKGLDLLVQAYARVADQVTADLHLLGDGPDEAQLRRSVEEAGIADRVHFWGRVDGGTGLAVLSQAQLVLMPSRYETFGMVAAEALSVGTPVLAFDIPCLSELLPPTVGRLVAAGDVAAFAAELLVLAQDPALCRQLGGHGPASVAHLDWDRLAADQLAVYRRVAGHAPAVPAGTSATGVLVASANQGA